MELQVQPVLVPELHSQGNRTPNQVAVLALPV